MRVDVGVPVFNGGWKLSRALTSLRKQTYADIRILVSDNGSTDESREIAREHANQDSRVVLLSGPEDGLAASNFTQVLHTAEAPAFMWAAHDDVWDRNFVAQGVAALDSGFQYFSANWWVGDIERNVGSSAPRHPLRFLESESRVERVLRFANLNPLTHKCNLVYAMFRHDLLVDAYAMQDISNDGLLSLAICAQSPGHTSDRVLFFKDNPQEARRYRAERRLPDGVRSQSRRALEVTSVAIKGVLGRGKNSCTFTDYKDLFYDRATELFPEYRQTLAEIAAQHGRFTTRSEFLGDIDARIRDLQ